MQYINADPVAQLDSIFIDNLGEDWGVLNCPEEAILYVPKGTVEQLLRQINKQKRWPSLYETAQQHSEQWVIDLTEFFPHEEEFIELLVALLSMMKTEHGKVCLAQDADQWLWGSNTNYLLPYTIELISQVREDIKSGDFGSVIPTLDHVIQSLSEKIPI
ncbi:hypothetical protein JCM14076_13940 [Methylosoma difficile]